METEHALSASPLPATAAGTGHFTGSPGTQSLLKALATLAFILPSSDVWTAATTRLKIKSNLISIPYRDESVLETGSHVSRQALNSRCG